MIEMLKECDKKSLTRYICVTTLLLFAFITLYLLLLNRTWPHYDTFTFSTVPTVFAAILGNKYISAKSSQIQQINTTISSQNKKQTIERKQSNNG